MSSGFFSLADVIAALVVLRILQGEQSDVAAEEPLARTLSMNPAG